MREARDLVGGLRMEVRARFNHHMDAVQHIIMHHLFSPANFEVRTSCRTITVAEDGDALLQFSIQLTSCTNTLKEIGSLSKLDHPENLKKIINRLPFGMRLKGCDTVDHIIEKEGRDVTIEDMTEFVTAKARAATHTIFGKIVNENKGKQEDNKGKRQFGSRVSGFSTQGVLGKPNKSICLCNANHWLSRCDKFRKLSLEERKKYKDVQESTQPFFTQGLLKLMERTTEKGRLQSNGYVKISSKSSQLNSSSVTGLAIVPVRVKAKGRSEVVETYAFLDLGSNTSFCTESLLKKLKDQGEKTKLSLTTMLGEGTPTECSMVKLEIFDLDNQSRVELAKVYSTPSLPIRSDCIGKQEDIDRWPHLQGISIPHIEAEIGLLIGSDAPEILQPQEHC
ncbi:Hypothetical predicted protein [Paramuricea clavata]|uniref:Uncharacterized protein n=1 Tax=Paramuricea clavata TaxID=317549 RepID=A0A6S7J3S0_PARCT|nr:Hypothetical predicted protein [Paramuricea clavata]